MAISISEKARRHLGELELADERFLRVAVVPGGCAGLVYSAFVDTARSESDVVVHEESSFRIIADSGSALFVGALHIDYSENGLHLSSTDSRDGCACGSSFSV